jgi:hypothetical protein
MRKIVIHNYLPAKSFARDAGNESAPDVERLATWLKSYAKNKPVKNFGGNFWGINRNRCTIIPPEQMAALEATGKITRTGNQFTMR